MVVQDRIWGWDAEAIWQKYCGFLDLNIQEFNEIQQALLLDELLAVHSSSLGRRVLKGTLPTSVNEFRRNVRFTRYSDYLPDLHDGNDTALVQPAFQWVESAGAENRHIPYTLRAYEVVSDNMMAAFILSCAAGKGEVNIGPGDRALYATPPGPSLSGLLPFEMAGRFGLQSILDPLESEAMEYWERAERGLTRGLATGVNLLVSIDSILVHIGEEIAFRQEQGALSSTIIHPLALARLGYAYLKSKLQHRGILPRDLWSPKAILAWGIESPSFCRQVEYYWGKSPYRFYSCAEGGVVALQGWNKNGMTLIPYSNFYEFIPEKDSIGSWEDVDSFPSTLLMDELEAGKRYEIVITNFYGMPLLRYRVGHLIKVIALEDEETGVELPQIEFESSFDEVNGLTGSIRKDEKSSLEALGEPEVGPADRIIEEEPVEDKSMPHLRQELAGSSDQREISETLNCLSPGVAGWGGRSFGGYEGSQNRKELPVTELYPGVTDGGKAGLYRVSSGEAVLTRQSSIQVPGMPRAASAGIR